MKDLLIVLAAIATLTISTVDAAAQRGGRGGGGFGGGGFDGGGGGGFDGGFGGGGGRGGNFGGGFNGNFNNNNNDTGAPSQLPQAPADFGAPPALPTDFSPAPALPTNFAPAPAAANPPTPATTAAANNPAAKPVKPTTVRVVDGLVSVQATDIPLSQLVKLLDNAMGTNSRIKKELETRKVSVRFEDLPYDAAVRKIFQGVPLDYIVVPGEGVIVTAASGTVSTASTSVAAAAVPQPVPTNPVSVSPFEGAGLPGMPPPVAGIDPFAPAPGTQPAQPQQPPQGAQAPAPAPPVPTMPPAQNINDPFSGGGLSIFGAPPPAPAPAPAPAPGGGLPLFGGQPQPFN